MGYTHGTSVDAEFRTCTCCNKTFPNSIEYFRFDKKKNNYLSQCRECCSKKNKEKRLKKIEENKNKSLFYEGTKKCICCRRDLPNNKLYFVIDLSCVSGLRNKCRECDPKAGRFLEMDYKVSEKWTEEDLQILKENYNHYTGKELKELFFPNRTIRAIESQADVLGYNTGKDERVKQIHSEIQREIALQHIAFKTLSEETRKKLSEYRKEYYKTHDAWNKGIKLSPERCKQISERQKGKWAGDKNPRHLNPLVGENNGRWKGGINNTYFELRSDTKDWQQESMSFCGYRCVITGGEFDNVHHTTPFRDIVDEAIDKTNIEVKPQVKDYTNEEFEILRNQCKELHNVYGLGACLNETIHKLFHDTYGYTKFTPYNFLEFVYDISYGKYNEWFIDNDLMININDKYIKYLESIVLN